MKIYKVGGAVRDYLMGIEPKDIDYVVIGSSPEEMISLGYEQVGASFPVFLKNGEEYALARTERKSGVGYNGFDVTFDSTITLEDDLIRRDLTINAMAQDMETGEIIDPFGGRDDIVNKVLRHTSEAFADDPVRVLRVARFAARYQFDIDADTLELMRKVAPELEHVPTERIWAEFQKGLMEDRPIYMMWTLDACGALDIPVMRPYSRFDIPLNWVTNATPLMARFALISAAFRTEDYDIMSIPSACAKVSRAFHDNGLLLVPNWYQVDRVHRLTLLMRLRVPSDLQLLEDVLQVVACVDRAFGRGDETRDMIMEDVKAIRGVDAAAIAASCAHPKDIKDALFQVRLNAMKEVHHV